ALWRPAADPGGGAGFGPTATTFDAGRAFRRPVTDIGESRARGGAAAARGRDRGAAGRAIDRESAGARRSRLCARARIDRAGSQNRRARPAAAAGARLFGNRARVTSAGERLPNGSRL